jgi:hypothetical protein
VLLSRRRRSAPPRPDARGLGADPPQRAGQAQYLARMSVPRSGIMACMAEPFSLHTADGYEWVMYPPVDPYGDGYVRIADVEIRADGMTAHTTATLSATFDKVDLAEFVAGLASDWRGWEGRRQWEALEQEMAIEAWHDGRANVMLAVTVRRPERTYADDAWSARVVFTVEAGEQLSVLARDIASLLSV